MIKWEDYAIIGLIIFLCLAVVILKNQNQSNKEIINQLNLVVDSLQNQTTKSVVEYRDRVKTNTNIIDRWSNIYTIDSFTSIDTLYLQAKTDINYLDTSLKKCDTALNNCLALANTQNQLINAYKGKKQPLIFPYLGVGLSYSENFKPAIQVGVGLNLNKIVGK